MPASKARWSAACSTSGSLDTDRARHESETGDVLRIRTIQNEATQGCCSTATTLLDSYRLQPIRKGRFLVPKVVQIRKFVHSAITAQDEHDL